MSRLTRHEHEELSGGVFAPLNYFNGFQSLLGGVYLPDYLAQTNGSHSTQMIDLLASIGDLLANTPGPVVYKDGDDTNSQFRVALFSIAFRGHVCTLGSTGPYGDLVEGVNYIWADLTAAPTMTIAFGAAWPVTPHLKIASIDMPAAGPWRPNDLVSLVGQQAAVAHRSSLHAIRIDFDYTSGASVSASTVPAGAIVVPDAVVVHSAFNGAAPAVKVGDAGDDDSLIQEADVDLTTIGHYAIDRSKLFSVQTALTAAITQDSSTAGSASILMRQY